MSTPLRTWKGRRVRSAGDDAQSAARKVPESPRSGSLFFIPSPLEGWGLDVLLDRLPDKSAVVVFEKDEELDAFVRPAFEAALGPRLSHPRLFRLRADTEAAVRDLFARLPLDGLRRVEFLPLNGAWLAHAARCREVLARLEQGIQRWWTNRATALHLGRLWVKNLFDNLGSRDFSLESWPHWGSDTVLVCGAGPTLETALPWARAHRHRLRVLAVDTALGALKPWDIVPDAVVAVESQHANLDDFAGWSGARVPLFADLTSYPGATRVFAERPHWFVSEFAPLSFWNRWPDWPEVPRLPPLGSVGVLAADLAWSLTRGHVILAGLDFSYRAGKSHARGTPAVETVLRHATRLSPVGQPVWSPQGWSTSPALSVYASLLAERLRPYAGRVWLWEQAGAPLGLKPWPRSALLDPLGVIAPARSAPRDAVGRWLDDEVLRWKRILEGFERVNRLPSDPDWAALEADLSDVDYLTFDFPDPAFRRDSDWLIRAKNRVLWIQDRLAARTQN